MMMAFIGEGDAAIGRIRAVYHADVASRASGPRISYAADGATYFHNEWAMYYS